MLSLDAPAVALVWQAQFARIAHGAIGWPEAFVLGVSTWLAYAADRWIEGWRLESDQIRTQRHHFYHRWRWPIGGLWFALFAADVSVALVRLTPRELAAGALLLGPIALYLLSHQLVHRDHPWRAPKEICVAMLIAGGAAVFVLAPAGAPWAMLAAPLGLFCLLCFTNCALISAWEHEVDTAHGQLSLARQFGRARRLIHLLPWVLAAGAAIGLGETRSSDQPAVLCVSASAVLLGLIDLAEPWLGWQLARVLADVALLTPLAIVLAP